MSIVCIYCSSISCFYDLIGDTQAGEEVAVAALPGVVGGGLPGEVVVRDGALPEGHQGEEGNISC